MSVFYCGVTVFCNFDHHTHFSHKVTNVNRFKIHHKFHVVSNFQDVILLRWHNHETLSCSVVRVTLAFFCHLCSVCSITIFIVSVPNNASGFYYSLYT
jgi:hypothetical protein